MNTNATSSQNNNSYQFHVMNHMDLRKTLGVIGISFPFILMIGGFILEGFKIQPSISDYYGTSMRDVFVGYLVSIGLFLYTYRYDTVDNRIGNIAGLFAILIALFPATSSSPVVRYVHFISAGLFFLSLVYFCLVLFTKSNTDSPTPRKKIRNRIYRICGYTILACILILVIYFIFKLDWSRYSFVFWIETIALLAFGTSWLVKGEFILEDQ